MTGRSLRIAHIDTERTWRGGENQVFALAKGLEAHGHKNLMIVRKGGALAKKLKEISSAIYEVSPWGEWDPFTARRLRKDLIHDDIDVVHAHTAHGLALAALATRGTQIPVVSTRRVDFHLSKNIFSQWKYRCADKIVAISHGVKKILEEDGIPSAKITIVPSGIDFSRFEGLTKATRAEMKLPADAVIVGQVAALAPHKDQTTFLKAIARLKDRIPKLQAVLIGEGEMREELTALANQLGIASIVSFLGFRSDALRFLAAFDIFCLSSEEEGLGTSILDAMELRVPVVATRVGGIPELIEDKVSGYLVPPHDAEKLAEALAFALQSKAPNQEIVEAAYKKARAFDIRSTVSQMEQLYFSLV